MRARKDVCIFCRHVFNLPKKNVCAQRMAYSTKDEPYVLPRLVIDLDASDSKFVKKLEDQEPSGSHHHVDEPFKLRRMREKSRGLGSKEMVKVRRLDTTRGERKNFFNTQTVIPQDLLRYSLLGDPTLAPTRENDYLRRIFKTKSIIPLQFGGDKILQLLSHFSTDPTGNLERAGFNQQSQFDLRERLRKCSTFLKLERMVSMIATTSEGCQFLASAGAEIAEGIRMCRIPPEGATSVPPLELSAWMVLNLLNNLRLNMTSKGVKFPGSLCTAGLYYASKIGFTPAIKSYLDEILANSYAISWYTIRALINLQRHCERTNLPKRIWAPWLDEAERRDLSIGLITGYYSPAGDFQGKQRNSCFANLIDLSYEESLKDNKSSSFDTGIYCTYITGLGELGLTDVLWSEWMASGGSNVRVKQLSDHPITEMFFFAFLLAKDKPRALSVLENTIHAQDGMDQGDVTDSQSNFSTRASTLTRILASKPQPMPFVQKMIYQHYWYHGLQPEENLRAKIELLVPNQPLISAIADIEKVLLVGYRHDFNRWRKNSNTKLEKSDYGSFAGLMVSSPMGKIPLCFKGDGEEVTELQDDAKNGDGNGDEHGEVGRASVPVR